MRRLTPKRFKDLLDKNPDFELTRVTFNPKTGEGCALTLDYIGRNGSRPLLAGIVAQWAEMTYGAEYVGAFVFGFDFDGSPVSRNFTSDSSVTTLGFEDGLACCKLAKAVGRI